MQACDRCHARKTRCDRRIPSCGSCEKAGTQCLHKDKLRQRNMPRGYIDGMEKLVHELTNENAKLRRQLQCAPQTAVAPANGHAHSNSYSALPSTSTFSASTQSQNAQGDADNSTSSSRSSPGDNIIALEVGYLSLTATGETRYLGSGSGMSLANMVSSVISTQSGMSLPVEPSVSDGPVPSTGPTPPIDSPIPPLADATPLIEAYFKHTHITFPLLHEPSFMATVGNIYEEPSYYEMHPFEAFTFDMVLAIGSSNFNRLEEPTTSAAAYYARAQSKVRRVMAMDGMKILRAILLISHHGIFSNLRDTSASIWHLVGIGARLCFEQGLHLEHGRLSGGKRNFSHRSDTIVLEEEMKRRCFWCLYNLDRVVSFTLGRPLVIRDEEIDVSLPSHLTDHQLSADHPVVTQGSPDGPLELSPFLHLIRIRRVSGRILNTFHNSRHGTFVSMEEKMQIRRRFHQEIDSWKEDTKHLNLIQQESNQSYVSSFLTQEWYDAVFNNAMLLLYRPSPFIPHPTMMPGSHGEEAELMTLLKAAKASIDSYSALRHMRRLNYSWITLHGVFLAGVAYIYCVGRLLRDSTHRYLSPDLLSIIEVTRGCSNVLVAICERWNVSRRSCDLFNKLSNAVIADRLNTKLASQYSEQDHQGNRLNTNPMDTSMVWHQGSAQENESSMSYHSTLEQGALGAMPQLDQILVMDEFRNYASTLDTARQGEDSIPSELLSSFSQDWPFEIPFDEQGPFDSSMPMDTTFGRPGWLDD
ncbi:fungal-specific transcription factor domain-containing protein [Pyrenochaeta sp. MPI-SDFR-AT-0127]|nr:fungal-specific transcription factor domain-containing protein [Pyrenochaeta sp. MPI-SDFR-AT-0127]